MPHLSLAVRIDLAVAVLVRHHRAAAGETEVVPPYDVADRLLHRQAVALALRRRPPRRTPGRAWRTRRRPLRRDSPTGNRARCADRPSTTGCRGGRRSRRCCERACPAGTARWPTTEATVSVRYLPTMPPELPRPLRMARRLRVEQQPGRLARAAESTTVRQRTWRSSPVALSMYDTAVTLPEASVTSSRAMALASTVTRPVSIAGKICT